MNPQASSFSIIHRSREDNNLIEVRPGLVYCQLFPLILQSDCPLHRTNVDSIRFDKLRGRRYRAARYGPSPSLTPEMCNGVGIGHKVAKPDGGRGSDGHGEIQNSSGLGRRWWAVELDVGKGSVRCSTEWQRAVVVVPVLISTVVIIACGR